jgi:hypothetical protein
MRIIDQFLIALTAAAALVMAAELASAGALRGGPGLETALSRFVSAR